MFSLPATCWFQSAIRGARECVMRNRFLPLMVAVVCVVGMVVAPAAGQEATPADTWKAPRTPDGHPDLQGLWTNATITPFERGSSFTYSGVRVPESVAGEEFFTAEEVASFEAQTVGRRVENDGVARQGSVGAYNNHWLDAGTQLLSTRQTSLVVDPPDGRVPVKAWAEAVRDYNREHRDDHFRHMSVWDRCISRGVPGSMFPAGYNNAYRILQVPGYVVIVHEMIHDARIIPVADRPHVDENIRQWMGDSRAYWEGDTLVVDTRNFHGRGWIANSGGGGRMKGIPASERLHVVERFTRESEDTLMWEARVDDPNVYEEPWTVSMPLTRDPKYDQFEYACHEGNLAVINTLGGGRALDAAGR